MGAPRFLPVNPQRPFYRQFVEITPEENSLEFSCKFTTDQNYFAIQSELNQVRPISSNAATGLLTTLINMCISKGRSWSVIAISTVVVTGLTIVIFLTLLVIL
jgi:hypothetical protein